MAASAPQRVSYRRRGIAPRFVVRAAAAAPSVYNTQPWRFATYQHAIRLYADLSRKLAQADPAGREMMISCGAALCNLRLAVRHLGFAAKVTLLPDLSRPDLLAEIGWGWHAPPTAEEELLYQSITRRHTHRGPFTADAPPLLTGELMRMARHEQAELQIIYDPGQHRPLAELIRIAEQIQRTYRGFAAERARWARPPGDRRRDGVPPAAYPAQPDGLEFTTRDFACGTGWGHAPLSRPDIPHAMGLVALLTTRDDSRLAWLLAGHALQRLLLHATAQNVSAAFHTQPLELPRIREQIRAEFADCAHPQMLLRLGRDSHAATTPRRPVTDILIEER
jgi:nitroreductase